MVLLIPMPYKDPDKQREAMRKIMRKRSEKEKREKRELKALLERQNKLIKSAAIVRHERENYLQDFQELLSFFKQFATVLMTSTLSDAELKKRLFAIDITSLQKYLPETKERKKQT